jgi:hypothetical protein
MYKSKEDPKHYTTIEQSKKLLELGLNPETADMLWEQHFFEIPYVTVKPYTTKGRTIVSHILPCWSLGALMELMPKICEDENDGGCYPTVCKGFDTDMWHCVYRRTLYVTDWYKSPIDAAFEMVVWLLKNNYIN